jgi:hypothetical protein
MRIYATPLLAALLLFPCPALPCDLCGTMSRRNSLAFEFEQATVVVYGHLANPRFESKPGRPPGSGTTEFHVDKIIKDDPAFPRQKMLTVSRYLPVLDAKSPPRYVMFYRSPKEGVEPYWGKEIASTAVLEFVAELHRQRDDPKKMLLYAAKHFDDKDANVADEAFMVFAKASDKMIAQTAKELSPATLRKLIKDEELEPERLSMFAYLLGACGDAKDAELLRSLLANPVQRNNKAYEGILAGYITMKPKEGWKFALEGLQKTDQKTFLLRYATLRTMRFFYNAKHDEFAPQVMQGLGLAIANADVADIAIQDLKGWKRWEHSKLILSCYDKASHKSAIVQNSILRYAIACPQPEAKALVERVRKQDPELIKYLEEELK